MTSLKQTFRKAHWCLIHMHEHVHVVDRHTLWDAVSFYLCKLLKYFELYSDKMNSDLKISADTIKNEEPEGIVFAILF